MVTHLQKMLYYYYRTIYVDVTNVKEVWYI